MYRPGKRFNVGLMRHRIAVQSHQSVRDATGQKVATWADRLADEPASYHATGGGTSYRGSQLAEDIAAVFVVRFRDGYSEDQRVIHDGRVYGITMIRPVDGGRRYLELMCQSLREVAA